MSHLQYLEAIKSSAKEMILEVLRSVSVVSPGSSYITSILPLTGTGSIHVHQLVLGVHKNKAPALHKRTMPSSHFDIVLSKMTPVQTMISG